MIPALLTLALLATTAPASEPDAALLQAARAGDAVRLRRLLAAGARPETRDSDGFTPLMRAAASSSADCVRLLIGAGADPNAVRPSGWSALMAAVASGRLEAVRLLLEAGAPPDARDRGFGTALDLAERGGQVAITDLLRRHGARGSGRSIGDRVCVLRWNGAGLCGRIEAIHATRYLLRVDRVRGCEEGCAADAECSENRAVGGDVPGAVGETDLVWTRSWCLTNTGLE